MGRPALDLHNKKFGKLTVVKKLQPNARGHIMWLCKCDCGNNKEVEAGNLKSLNTISCGCSNHVIKHGFNRRNNKDYLYDVWINMKNRCNDINNTHYNNYGERGIRVCKEWNTSFEKFRAYITQLDNCPVTGKEKVRFFLDRINNDKNYKPGNVKWSTRKEQQRNTRSNIIVTYKGQTMCLAEAVEKYGKSSYDTIYTRFKRYGWSIERALTT